MRRLDRVLELAAVIFALCVWGFIPELLREHDYNLLAAAVFLVLPVCFFELAYRSNGRQRTSRPQCMRRHPLQNL